MLVVDGEGNFFDERRKNERRKEDKKVSSDKRKTDRRVNDINKPRKKK